MDPTIVNSFKVISVLAFVISLAWLVHVLRRTSSAPAPATKASAARPTVPIRPAAPPIASRAPTPPPPPTSLNTGAAAYQQRGAAKTAKLPASEKPAPPVVPPPVTKPAPGVSTIDDEAMDSLFSNLAKPATDKSTEVDRKVSRLEELGFHHSINPTDPAAKAQVPSAPRSNTAELNAILSRIDQFLAEDPPADGAKPEVPTSTESTAPAQAKTAIMQPVVPETKPKQVPTEPQEKSGNTTPLWARPDAVDDDVAAKPDSKGSTGEQQRLF